MSSTYLSFGHLFLEVVRSVSRTLGLYSIFETSLFPIAVSRFWRKFHQPYTIALSIVLNTSKSNCQEAPHYYLFYELSRSTHILKSQVLFFQLTYLTELNSVHGINSWGHPCRLIKSIETSRHTPSQAMFIENLHLILEFTVWRGTDLLCSKIQIL